MKHILILVNGDYGDYQFCKTIEQYDEIICADNGMRHARALGIKPDLIVGDFDSACHQDLQYFKDLGVKIETFNPHKDATDTQLAIERAISRGAQKITIWGGVGTRLDHSLGNVQLLYKLLLLGIEGELVNPYNSVKLGQGKVTLQGKKGNLVSLLPFAGDVHGITTMHLEYPLDNADITLGNSLGISNVMCEDEAMIIIKEGILLIIKAKD